MCGCFNFPASYPVIHENVKPSMSYMQKDAVHDVKQ